MTGCRGGQGALPVPSLTMGWGWRLSHPLPTVITSRLSFPTSSDTGSHTPLLESTTQTPRVLLGHPFPPGALPHRRSRCQLWGLCGPWATTRSIWYCRLFEVGHQSALECWWLCGAGSRVGCEAQPGHFQPGLGGGKQQRGCRRGVLEGQGLVYRTERKDRQQMTGQRGEAQYWDAGGLLGTGAGCCWDPLAPFYTQSHRKSEGRGLAQSRGPLEAQPALNSGL